MFISVVVVGLTNAEHGWGLRLRVALSDSLAVLNLASGVTAALETHLLQVEVVATFTSRTL